MTLALALVLVLVLALVLEISALVTLWPGGSQDRVLYRFLLEHLASSLLLTGAGWFLMPVQFRYPRGPLLLLLFNVAFFVPVLGMFGVYAAVVLAGYRRREKIVHPFAKLVLPEFVLSLREPDAKFSQGEIKSRLAHASIPTPRRLQSLLALQGIPARVSSPLLQDMLGDASDDIRLVAYGLLDSREKKITAQIHSVLVNLKGAEGNDMQLIGYKQLAELYWELVYAGLAQGDLRIHSLNQALSYADSALALAERDTGMLFLKGRILHELKSHDEAQRMLALAMEYGLPEFRALPYAVEIAFYRGDYATAQSQLARISASQITPMMKKAINFWVRRTDESAQPLSKEYSI